MRIQPLLSLLLAAVAFSSTALGDNFNGRHGDRDDRDHDRRVWSRREPRPSWRVSHMPPMRRHEWQPARPSYRHVWIPGCWRWRSGANDWLWISGYWALPPHEHVVYVAPRYEQVGGEVVYVDGGWCDETYARDDAAASGAVIGGVLGGVIGHQSHNTGVGVIAGAVVGSLIGHEVDRDRAQQSAEAARDRAAQLEAERVQAQANADLEKEKLIAQGHTVTDSELAAAQERARIAREKLAAAKAARDAQGRQVQVDRDAALARAAALEKANAEAASAEAELRSLEASQAAQSN